MVMSGRALWQMASIEADRLFRGFLPGKTTPRDLYQTTAIAKLL
jgi:hypothetical protein